MTTLSKFQTLPLLIADSIAQYLVNVRGSVCPLYPYTQIGYIAPLAKAAAEQWKILYNVSWCWRELALGYFCKRATVKLNAEALGHLEVTFDNWTSVLDEPNSDQHYCYVNSVTLRFGGISDELSKNFTVFADSWIDTISFPNATKIMVVLERGTVQDHRWFSSIPESDVTALQRITENMLKALPKFSRASIEMRGSLDVTTQCVTREAFAEHGFHKLLSSVSVGSATRDTNIESSTFIKEYPYLMSEASITRLLCSYPAMGERAVDVIIRNAPVLVTLVLDSFHLPLLKDIMLNKENNPIVYPRLKDFEYRVKSIFGRGKREKIINGVSFPVLERAKCQKMYIFDDDALFRGCGKTLKHLDMQVSFDAAKMLTEHGVVKRLQTLRTINLAIGNLSLSPDRNGKSCYLRFALGLVSKSTRSLVIRDFVDDYSIAETILQYPNVQNLVHLNLDSVKLQFTETAEMIQMLPNLEYFSYVCNGLGSAFRSVNYNKKPKLVLEKYYPLSLHLKYCKINTTDYTSPRSLAITALLLAIACPKLTFAKVPGKILDAYNNMIENAIGGEPYLKYSDRLQCLLRC